MPKNNKLCLPVDIINIIVEYSVNRCERCGKENIRKHYIHEIMSMRYCTKCAKNSVKVSWELEFDEYMYLVKMNISQANNTLKTENKNRKDLIIIDEKQIKKILKKRLKEDIIKILKEYWIYKRFSSKKEIHKILYKL